MMTRRTVLIGAATIASIAAIGVRPAFAQGEVAQGEIEWGVPVDSGTITSYYGSRDVDGTDNHKGIDIVPTGSSGANYGIARKWTPIYAVADGDVVYESSNTPRGIWLQVRHDNGYYSHYQHLDPDVPRPAVGTRVTRGQGIAGMGNSGRTPSGGTYSYHLHFEVHTPGSVPANSQTRAENPLSVLKWEVAFPGGVILYPVFSGTTPTVPPIEISEDEDMFIVHDVVGSRGYGLVTGSGVFRIDNGQELATLVQLLGPEKNISDAQYDNLRAVLGTGRKQS